MKILCRALCVLALSGQLAAAATIVGLNDLDDNQVPPGWTLDTFYGGPGLVDGKLWALPVDGRCYLTKELDPQGAAVVIEWDGNIVDNSWGGGSSIYVYDSAGHVFNLGNWYAERQGVNDHFFAGGYCEQAADEFGECVHGWTTLFTTTIPVELTDFHYTALLSDGMMGFVAQRLADGFAVFDMTIPVAAIGAAPIERVQHFVIANDRNGCWIDNLRLEYRPPTPSLGCIGFESPLDGGPVVVRGNRALPFKAALMAAEGTELTDQDLNAAPVIQVMYHPVSGGEPVDVTDLALPAGHGTDGNQFDYTVDGRWQYNLKVRSLTAPGEYEVTLASGDESEYLVEPACVGIFITR